MPVVYTLERGGRGPQEQIPVLSGIIFIDLLQNVIKCNKSITNIYVFLFSVNLIVIIFYPKIVKKKP